MPSDACWAVKLKPLKTEKDVGEWWERRQVDEVATLFIAIAHSLAPRAESLEGRLRCVANQNKSKCAVILASSGAWFCLFELMYAPRWERFAVAASASQPPPTRTNLFASSQTKFYHH